MHKLWINDETFLKSLEIENKEHYISTCKQISKLIMFSPIPIIISDFDKKYLSFYFQTGPFYCILPYDASISPHCHAHILYNWSKQYYPRYEAVLINERELNEEEIAIRMQNGADLNSIANETIKENVSEILTIDKIIFTDDHLITSLNGKKQERITKIPSKEFIKTFRNLKTEDEKRNFVKEKTKLINETPYSKRIDIRYDGIILENFIKIHLPEFWIYGLKNTEELLLKHWNKFNIFFSNEEQINKFNNLRNNYKTEYSLLENRMYYFYKNFKVKTGKKNGK